MNIRFELSRYSTIPAQKMPAYGFSLLECLIALFILAMMLAAVLPHQHLLIHRQKQHTQSWESQQAIYHQKLIAQSVSR